jgi:hypothetical protein
MLIERGLKHDLGGSAQLEFRAEGLLCALSVPWQYATRHLS